MALKEYQIRMIADKTCQTRIWRLLEEHLGAFEIAIKAVPISFPSCNTENTDPRIQSALQRRKTVLKCIEKRPITIRRMIAEDVNSPRPEGRGFPSSVQPF